MLSKQEKDNFGHFEEDMDDIVTTIKLLENSGGLIDGVAKTLNKMTRRFISCGVIRKFT